MTLLEWEAWIEGYQWREEEEWRRTRELIAAAYNTAMGAKKSVRGSELIPLPHDIKIVNVIPNLDDRYRISATYKNKRNVKLSANEFLRKVS